MKSDIKVCSRCVLDSSVDDIEFYDDGTCNYCADFVNRCLSVVNQSGEQRTIKRTALVNQIIHDGKGKQYDCIVGVSGGVDSSWALVMAKELGLRPLAVHMDNGWNSELAQNNIENLVKRLDVDLYTHVIDWNEYKRLMQAFFDADVIDVELLYDNAMLAVNYQLASKYGIKHILSGCNMATEGVRVPTNWNWFKKDKVNIKSIAKTQDVSLKTFPAIGTLDYVMYEFVKGIKWLPFLDYFDFNKEEALTKLESDFYYKRYPYKHYESIFTRFYQGYILPVKFNVDKRKLHFSTLILSGQMNRKEALKILESIPYPSVSALEDDKSYFLKKMGWSANQLEAYLNRPPRSHLDFKSEKIYWDFLKSVYFKIKK